MRGKQFKWRLKPLASVQNTGRAVEEENTALKAR